MRSDVKCVKCDVRDLYKFLSLRTKYLYLTPLPHGSAPIFLNAVTLSHAHVGPRRVACMPFLLFVKDALNPCRPSL
jgi:hypothetical protein